jgi:hypothetical protein
MAEFITTSGAVRWTLCRQLRPAARRPSVTGPTPSLSARGHLKTREAAWYCRLLDGYELWQSMHLAGARIRHRLPAGDWLHPDVEVNGRARCPGRKPGLCCAR